MTKTRVIPILLHRGGLLYKGQKFRSWRTVGVAQQAAKVHETRGVDELVVLNISGLEPNFDFVKRLTEQCFMPLTVGGGVTNMGHVRMLMNAGADKVCIGSMAWERPEFITEIAMKYGRQAVTVSIDVNEHDQVVIRSGSNATSTRAVEHAMNVEAFGAGEILLQSVPREGTMNGYDLSLIKRISETVGIPVIAASGAGTYQHMAEALDAGAHAVAAGAMFQFTDATPKGAAAWLAERGYNMRVAA